MKASTSSSSKQWKFPRSAMEVNPGEELEVNCMEEVNFCPCNTLKLLSLKSIYLEYKVGKNVVVPPQPLFRYQPLFRPVMVN